MFEKYPTEIVNDFLSLRHRSFYEWEAGTMRTVEVWHVMTGLLNSTESYFRAKFFGTYRYDTNTRILIQIQNAVIASIPIKDVNVKKSAMVELPAESNSSVTEQQNSDSKLISIADKKKRFSHVVVASK